MRLLLVFGLSLVCGCGATSAALQPPVAQPCAASSQRTLKTAEPAAPSAPSLLELFHRERGFTARTATAHEGSERIENGRRVWCTLEGNAEMGPKVLLWGDLLPLGAGKSARFELVDIYTEVVVREGESALPPRCLGDGIVFGESYYRAWDDTFVPFSMPGAARSSNPVEARCLPTFTGDLRLAHLQYASGNGCEGVWARDGLDARTFTLLGAKRQEEWREPSPTAQFLGVTNQVGITLVDGRPSRWVDLSHESSVSLGGEERFARAPDLLIDSGADGRDALWYLDYRSMTKTQLIAPGECHGSVHSEGEGHLVVATCAPNDGRQAWHAAFHLSRRERYPLDASTWGTVRPVGEARLVGVREREYPNTRLVRYELSNNLNRTAP